LPQPQINESDAKGKENHDSAMYIGKSNVPKEWKDRTADQISPTNTPSNKQTNKQTNKKKKKTDKRPSMRTQIPFL